MSSHIPFVNFSNDWPNARTMYPTAELYRVALQSVEKTARPGSGTRVWVDASVDALDNWPFEYNENYRSYFKGITNTDRVVSAAFQQSPSQPQVTAFVDSLLDGALSRIAKPEWLSVPQLPYVTGSGRNKINRLLAKATQAWKAKANYKGKLILPIILTNQQQLNNKTARNLKISLAVACLDASAADGVWVVDSTLYDQEAKANFESVRFPGLVKFHQELSAAMPDGRISIAGPYGALNLILWARGIVAFTAVAIGKTPRYRIPGAMMKQGLNRIVVAPLRRIVTYSPAVRGWLNTVLQTVPKSDPVSAEFSTLLKNFQLLSDDNTQRTQISSFYNQWISRLEAIAPQGRPLALFQEFSAAYVLGKSLPDIPSEKGLAKSASRIAEQFMRNCL